MEYNGAVNNLVGEKLYGFCDGYFGRDSYTDKVIIMNGVNWVVAIPKKGSPEIAYFDTTIEMVLWIKEHSCKNQSYTLDDEDEEDDEDEGNDY